MQLELGEIKLVVYDFDGVMTDNRIFIFDDGREAALVNRSDGLAVNEIKKMGINQLIMSSEKNPIVKYRAKKLGIPFIQAAKDKKTELVRYLAKNRVDKQRVIFVGNDLNDMAAMGHVGYPVAPADAHRDIKRIAKIILKARGGFGVVRELLDKLKRL